MIMDVHSVQSEDSVRRDSSSGRALLGGGAVVIWNDVAAEGRDEFYEWHDNEHIPERLAIPGFRRGRRFISPTHSPEWLTLYEADDLSVVTSTPYLARLNAPTPATVSALRHFRNTSRAACRVVHSCGASTGGHVLAMRLSAPQASGDPIVRYVCDEAFPRLMSCTGIVACHLLAADESGSYVKTAESSTRAFDVPSWVVLCEASHPAAAASARATIEGRTLDDLGVSVRNDAAVYALEICKLSLH
jgi:hypothetical protein